MRISACGRFVCFFAPFPKCYSVHRHANRCQADFPYARVAGCRKTGFRRTRRHQFRPLPERHDPVADLVDLSAAERELQSQLRPDRPDYPDHQITASILQPLVGLYTDKHRNRIPLALGMGFTLVGLLLCRLLPATASCCWRRRWSAPVLRSSIRNRRAWRAWLRAAVTAWRNRSSRSAAMPAVRWDRCWRPGS